MFHPLVCEAASVNQFQPFLAQSANLTNVINRAKFHNDRLRGIGLATTRILCVNIGKHVIVETVHSAPTLARVYLTHFRKCVSSSSCHIKADIASKFYCDT
jgi:hypothetical protein